MYHWTHRVIGLIALLFVIAFAVYYSSAEPVVLSKSEETHHQAPASASIVIDYVGDWRAEEKAAFEYAASIWEATISSTVPIHIEAAWITMPVDTLGSAEPYYNIRNFSSAPFNNTWYPAALANGIVGFDLSESLSDVRAQFNGARSDWYFGLDGNPPSNRYDFVTVVLRELGHGLGFIGTMNFDDGIFDNDFECFGSANYGCWGYFNGQPTNSPGVFDLLTQNGFLQSLTDTNLFANPSFDLANQLRSNSLFFVGTAATAANNGIIPRLWAPSTWEPGHSIVHLDELTYPFGTQNSLMTPYIDAGEAMHDPGSITIGVFSDIGWEINKSPVLLPLPAQFLRSDEVLLEAIDLREYTRDFDTPVEQLSYTLFDDAETGAVIRDNHFIDIVPSGWIGETYLTITVSDLENHTSSQELLVVIVPSGDTEPPELVDVAIGAGVTNTVPITASIQMTFNEVMNPNSLIVELTPNTGGNFSWNEVYTTATYTPEPYFDSGQDYLFTITDATDFSGNILHNIPIEIEFTTKTYPPTELRECPPPYTEANYGSPMDLSYCEWEGEDLSGLNWESVDLSHARLTNVNLNGNNLSNSTLLLTYIFDSTLNNINLSGADLTGIWVADSQMKNARFSGSTTIEYGYYARSDLRDCDMRYIQIQSDAFFSFVESNLNNCNFTGSDFSGGQFSSSNLTNAILHLTNLDEAYIGHADFTNTVGIPMNGSTAEHHLTICSNGIVLSDPNKCWPPNPGPLQQVFLPSIIK